MGAKCKICSASEDVRKQIEAKILQGEGCNDIAIYAKTLGIEVSQTSVRRHIDNHTELPANALDIGNLTKSTNQFQTTSFENWKQLNEFATQKLTQLFATQLLIVEQKQRQYLQGETKSPDKDIRNLETFYNMIAKPPNRDLNNNHLKLVRDNFGDSIESDSEIG